MSEGPVRRLLKEWQPLLPRPKLLGQVNSELEKLREAKKTEWLSRGYSPALVDKALLLAERSASGIADTSTPSDRPDVRDVVLKHSYPKCLEVANDWIKAVSK